MWSKTQLDIIPRVKSRDKENRKKLPRNMEIPEISSLGKNDEKYIEKASNFIDKKFNKNYGNIDNFIFLVTHATARRWLRDFGNKKLPKFGEYQDAISQESNTLFSFCFIFVVNIGLLNPMDIIDAIEDSGVTIPMNSKEGYIRNYFGESTKDIVIFTMIIRTKI